MRNTIALPIAVLAGGIVGACVVGKIKDDKIAKANAMSYKHLVLYRMMTQWVQVKQEGKNIAHYLEIHGYKRIAVYGMSYVGETLINELKGSDIVVAYGIDQNANSIYADIDIVSTTNKLEKVDAVVVTAVTFFDEIKNGLSEKMDCPVISLENILRDV